MEREALMRQLGLRKRSCVTVKSVRVKQDAGVGVLTGSDRQDDL